MAGSRASGCRRAEKVGDGGAPAGRPTTALDVPSPSGGGVREVEKERTTFVEKKKNNDSRHLGVVGG
jgi:hypothetical protein